MLFQRAGHNLGLDGLSSPARLSLTRAMFLLTVPLSACFDVGEAKTNTTTTLSTTTCAAIAAAAAPTPPPPAAVVAVIMSATTRSTRWLLILFRQMPQQDFEQEHLNQV